MSAADSNEPVHTWFELTYSSYLVLQRSLLQSMPKEWQAKFVALVEELDDSFTHLKDLPSKFVVHAKQPNGRYMSDPYADYQRGRRLVPRKPPP